MALCAPSKSGILYVTFNQDSTCIAIGSQQGVHIYNVDTHKLYYRHAIGAVSVVEMLFCTSLLAYVGAGEQPALTPRKLTVLNSLASRVIQELSYPTSVLAVRLNRQRLVVVTARRAHVYSMANLACLRVIDTEDNPKGCCALTPCSEPCLLALPASASTGTVRIYDLAQDGGNVLSEVQAHQGAVRTLAWSPDGALLASASAKGTVLRVHAMPAAACAHSFRRGATPAAVTCLAFSQPGAGQGPGQGAGARLLLAASSHGTVHVFRIEETESPRAPRPLAGPAAPPRPLSLSRPGSAAVGLLSAVMRVSVADMVEPSRHIAIIRLPQAVAPAACAFRQPPCLQPPASAPVPGPPDAAFGRGDPPDPAPDPDPAPSNPADALAVADAAAGCGGAAAGGRGAGCTAGGEECAEERVVIMVATCEGLLYEYCLTDLQSAAGPKCSLEGEWGMLGSGSVLG